MAITNNGPANGAGVTDQDLEKNHFFLDSGNKILILCQRNYYYDNKR